MQREKALRWSGVCILVVAGGMLWWAQRAPMDATEVPVTVIPLRGALAHASIEISSLTWVGDELLFLPQYPGREGGVAYALHRDRIEAFLDGREPGPVEARPVPFEAPGLESALPGFDGFEAVVADGDDLYLTVEANDVTRTRVAWLLHGRVVGDLERIVIDVTRQTELAPQNSLLNTGYEALVLQGDRILAMYETNGAVTPTAHALVFDRGLRAAGELPMGHLEYRVTDATDIDSAGRFWVSNYHWPGAPWQPGVCEITVQHGQGASHSRCSTVERLVELQVTDEGVAPTERPPILLELLDDETARNWEGVVRLGDRGFLMMTDEHPASIFAFVPFPAEDAARP